MAFDEKFISELKAKNDIVDVVGKYCVLQKRGNVNYWACCPLPGHSEKTPSFTVNSAGQFFKCFGCGRGGDVITFVETMENLDYVGAVKYLAERAGLALPDDDRDVKQIAKDRSDRERMLSLMKTTALFYVDNLRNGQADAHREYLKSRQIDRKVATAFGLGASLDMFSLPNYLKSKGFTEEEMIKCGVCQLKQKDDGKSFVYDSLCGRLIIPIINNLGNVIAFGGRLLEKKPNFAKYKNTKETELFIKNRTLYNINNLKKEKNLHGISSIIMVEGYMDVISVYAGGFRNVVASMGTSLTVEQARMLKRYADTVFISYDGDGAGQKATVRGLDILANEGLTVRVVRLPEGLDPDDVIKKFGAEAYGNLLKQSIPLVDFKLYNLKKEYDLRDTVGRRKYIEEALKVIAKVDLSSEKEDLLRKLGKTTGTTYESLSRDLYKIEGGEQKPNEPAAEQKTPETRDATAARFALCAMLFNKPYSVGVSLDGFDMSPVHRKLWDILASYREAGKEVFPSELSGEFAGDELVEYNAVLSAGDSVFGTRGEIRYFIDCVNSLKKETLENELKELNAIFAGETDTEKRKQLLLAISDLTAKLSSVSRR